MSYIIYSISSLNIFFEFFSDNYIYIILYSINFFFIFYIKYDCDFLNLFIKNLKFFFLKTELISNIYSTYLYYIKFKK